LPACRDAVLLLPCKQLQLICPSQPLGFSYVQHQLAVALDSQEKLAIQDPDAIKWTYTIMPFGPTNGPATFISFIHEVNSQWKAITQQNGLIINDNTNTKIIVEDIFRWAKSLEMALFYIECQLCICQAYQLSLSLRKSHIFPKRFEFVGIDVCSNRNCPATSQTLIWLTLNIIGTQ
jgi:hypothetical protein